MTSTIDQPRSFYVCQSVMARNYGHGNKWIAGVVDRQLSLVTYLVDVSHGQVWKRYVVHLKEFATNYPMPTNEPEVDIDISPSSVPESTPTVVHAKHFEE